ncbi:FAD-binding oxidoreductase [Nannocystis radixulma]|uniref:FAD-binding oxidoreductase n=1 Tax=Nannocystis radixulma TaxID=2995305 RepID=A0ABT5BH91_9BACT|nr:FAD-binding oxidoreductase [Nannocystis radixulma]MDC0672985.1 FAD-binding oxidoreductase [Nannocystis radixulma]
MGELWRALAAWRSIVGEAHVLADPAARRAAARATFSTTHSPSCIVRPGTLAELQACVRAAAAAGVPVYPSSRGRNLGYGSRVPTRDGAAILDLARLDAIADLDLELGTVSIEPGVTFAALGERLRGSGFTIARTGAPPDASVLANGLERGIGRGRHGTRADRLCGLHVVLGDGSLLRTGFDREPTARCRGLSRFGLGPDLDGMFFQSRLGVVARATLWLTPRPAWSQALRFTLDRRERLAAVIDALRPLKLADALPHTISLYNDRRLLTLAGPRPDCPEGQALSQAAVDRHNPAGPRARWLGQLVIDGPDAAVGAATLALVETCLKGHVDELAARSRSEPEAQAGAGALARLYWPRGEPPALPDPLADECGLLWCAPVVPARGAELAATIAWLEDQVLAHGFDPAVSVQWAEPRVTHVVLALLFDRRRAGEDARALACHDAVLRGLAARGLLPYRLGLPSMHLSRGTDPVYAATLTKIRRALDPGDILAPGRYDGAEPSEMAEGTGDAFVADAISRAAAASGHPGAGLLLRAAGGELAKMSEGTGDAFVADAISRAAAAGGDPRAGFPWGAAGDESANVVTPTGPTRRWQFGRVELTPAELELRGRLGESLVKLVMDMPAPLRAGATAFLDAEARGRGPAAVLRKFPPPLWSHLLLFGQALGAELADEAGLGQALALLLHLLDDHLCDGQLRCEPALLQLRTRAWSRFEASIARLAAGLAGAEAFASLQIDRHFAAVDRARGDIELEAALASARGEMATWLIVPGLCAWRAGGVAARDVLVGALERLFVAWRIVDDLDDVADDARRGAVNLVLAGLNDDCTATDRLAVVGEALAERARNELACAAAEADAHGWSRLGAQFLALARPLAAAT